MAMFLNIMYAASDGGIAAAAAGALQYARLCARMHGDAVIPQDGGARLAGGNAALRMAAGTGKILL